MLYDSTPSVHRQASKKIYTQHLKATVAKRWRQVTRQSVLYNITVAMLKG